ncbi:hypothetical protein GC176_24170 [bacterium]|nr:hypothetical protein [bacterium]
MSGPSISSAPRLAGLTARLREPQIWMSLLLFGGAVVVVVSLTLHGMQSDNSVAGTDSLVDGQVDAALLSLGAVGVSDSANPNGELAGSGPLDLTAEPSMSDSEPAPLFALNEASPAIMFEQAKVTNGPLFGTPHSVPSRALAATPTVPEISGGAVTAHGVRTTELEAPRFARAIDTANAESNAASATPTQPIRPVSGVRSAAWLTGTIE